MGSWENGGTCHSLKYRKLQVEPAVGVCSGGDESMRSLVATLQEMSYGQPLTKDVLQSLGFVYNQFAEINWLFKMEFKWK